jgi:DNA-binding transcriptional regulator YiaG
VSLGDTSAQGHPGSTNRVHALILLRAATAGGGGAVASGATAVGLAHLPSSHTTKRSRTAHGNILFCDICKVGSAVDLVEKSLYSAEYQRLCALLVRLRRDAGLTQVRVAESLGVPQSFVSKYESGQRRLDVIELDHIATALGTTLHAVVDALKSAGRPSKDT